MIFHENLLLADDSHEISYLSFCRKLGKMLQNLSSVAFMIGALRVIHTIKMIVLHSFLRHMTSRLILKGYSYYQNDCFAFFF